MKITDVKTVLLTGPSTDDPYSKDCRSRRSCAFIEVYTDTELKGVGETYAGYFIPEIIPEVVEFFRPILIGKNVDNIDLLWDYMYQCGNFWCRTGVGLQVLTGIDAALYDLKGKMYGVPVYELLGGRKNESLFCYASGAAADEKHEKTLPMIEYYLSLGFKAVKMAVGVYRNDSGFFNFITSNIPDEAAEIEVSKLEAIKQRFGKDVTIMLDGHMGNWSNFETTWTLDTAKTVMKACEPYNLFFFEEPLHYNDPWGYAELCKSTSVPIAGGECLAGSHEWKLYIERNCFDIGQPDASYVGGLGEFMKIAQLLEGSGKKIATHSWSAGAGFMQNIHAAFACRNMVVCEIAPAYGPLHREIIGDSFVMKNGRILPPQKPGLGIELSEKTKGKFPFVRGSGECNPVPGKQMPD